MKFINYIEKIGGVDIYGLISLGIFVVFFLVVLIRVYKADKKEIQEISQLPLDN